MIRIALLLVATCLAVAGCGGGPDDGDLDAKIACKNFVEDALRAPSTADFQGYGGMSATGTDGDWTISGYVDSENGFGAQIRTDWTCQVRSSDGGKTWNLEDMSGLG